jgi:hypothetical protein
MIDRNADDDAAASGTLRAARTALSDGLAANLAGGTHHAFGDHGEGFCVLNDVAVAICKFRAEGAIGRAATRQRARAPRNCTRMRFAKRWHTRAGSAPDV